MLIKYMKHIREYVCYIYVIDTMIKLGYSENFPKPDILNA